MNIKPITYYVVDSFDFDEFVLAYYDKEYDFVAVMESSNDVDHSFSTNVFTPEANNREIASWKNGECDYAQPSAILGDLAARGVIPRGDYLIRVSW